MDEVQSITQEEEDKNNIKNARIWYKFRNKFYDNGLLKHVDYTEQNRADIIFKEYERLKAVCLEYADYQQRIIKENQKLREGLRFYAKQGHMGLASKRLMCSE